MKPIPDDVPPEVKHLAQGLRELIGESLPPTVPMSALAKAAGIGKSTLFHALSGQRVPNLDTVLMVVNACEAARTEPDIVGRNPDGSVFIAEVKKNRMSPRQKQLWTTLVNHARHPVSRPEDFDLLYFPGHGTTEDARPRFLVQAGDTEVLPEVRPSAFRVSKVDVDFEDSSVEEVGVADAAAMLDRALRSLEQATRDVTHARAVLARALAASATGAETSAAVAEEAARSGYATMREELLDAEQRRERDQPAPGDVEGNVVR
ncbi:hypothetical protein [Streptomyces cahuitamycinicus]|uniref:Uncharacterized protein n=1 Tax=Streptomyces cahuitamycinicus TaxID=2070367 RepID=A0A2N8TSC0_9ACTN|nr:hypothetical protein [Streptomyces cahuitamycinicus]PNG21895.1 hypothetical protein C1J00_12365 [Streptomyces cahuitamycinicus]